jgi:hypothetical protein
MPTAQVDEHKGASRDASSNVPALARTAAERAPAIPVDDIPPNVVALAKIHLLDQLGVGLVAATLPHNRPLAALACALETGGSSTALGLAAPVPAAAAVAGLERATNLAALTSALRSVA